VEDGLSAGFFLLTLGIGLILSAFFSSTETAFFSLTQSIISELKEAKDTRSRRVIRLLENPKELLITILTGNALVNFGIAVLATFFALRIIETTGIPASVGLAAEVLIITAIVLILGEITPKIIAIRYSRSWALWTALPIDIIRIIFFPVTKLLGLISSSVSRSLGVERQRLFISEDEIKTLVEVSEERGELEADEKEMIQGIIEISETTVKEIMVPRVDISCLPITASVKDVIRMVKKNGHSRLPIYNDNLDNIAGLIHVKDLLPYLENGDRQVEISGLIRDANFVPEGKKIDDLLHLFQREKSHMAIVVDEYGGTSGLVTLEDVLEEIVGEIQDEYDQEEPLTEQIDDNTLIADARINIGELNEILVDNTIPEMEDYETLGGFIFAQIGDLPEPKEVIDYENLRFTVEEIFGKRIGRIRIEKRALHQDDKPE